MPMKVALIGSYLLKVEFQKLFMRLKERGIPSCAIGLTSNWDSQKAKLVEKLRSVSHLVILLEQEGDWFPFMEGYASAQIPPGVVFVPSYKYDFSEKSYVKPAPATSSKDLHMKGTDISPPTILPLFTQMESLVEYLEAERFRVLREEERFEAKEYIVNAGVGLSEENLALCVQEGKIDFVQRFLVLGYSPDTMNSKGIPLLILAVRNRHRELAFLLMQAKADVNKISADRGSSALMEAAVQGDSEMVTSLIDRGADLDLRSKNGQTALMLAIGEGKSEIARLLIQKGADLTPTDALGMTAKKYAELFKQKEILTLIEERMKGRM